MTRPRIVLATIAAGGGHMATARAMAEGVEALEPGSFELTVTDLMRDLGFADLDARHKARWRAMLARPWTARHGQRLVDAFPSLTQLALRRALDGVARAAAAHFGALRPALVVANHAFLTVALTQGRRRYGLTTPVLTFATEPLDASALWAVRDADHVVVPSRPALVDLVRMGVGPDRIDVIGYPVQQAFLRPPARAAARARLGLDERFTCLVSLGGEGIGGDAAGVVDALLGLTPPPQVVVVTGRNEALATSLRALERDGLVVRGVVDTMADHLAACDVVVGKAGPASVMEALAVGRPVLVTGCAGLNELAVLRFLEARGLGHDARDRRELLARVGHYATSATALGEVAEASRALDFGGMTARLAAYLVETARRGVPRVRTRDGGLA